MARIFPTSRRLGRILFAAAALALTGCALTPQNAQWGEADSPKENKVVFLRQTHVVHFAPDNDRLSDEESRLLDTFLSREAVGYGDRISLVPAATGHEARDERLALRRGEAVAAHLNSLGVRAAAPERTSFESADTVTVVVGRYVVIPPHCPDWRKPSEDDPSNTPSSNLGCATATNLGLMVADPGDLVYGQPAPVSDGDHDVYSVQRYRTGTIRMPHGAYEKTEDEFQKGTGIKDETKQ
jgi:pilus assembly protein CpaD